MTKSTASLVCFGLISPMALGSCDYLSKKPGEAAQAKLTYTGCLQPAIAGSHLSVEDIRTLCAEAAQVIDAHYDYKEGGLAPSNEFTRCYDAQRKDFEAHKLNDAIRLAKLSCKYPDVK